MAKNGFDASMMTRDLNRVFGEYLKYNRRSSALLLEQQADKLAAELHLQAAALRPAQQAKITALPARLGYRIKRRLAAGIAKGNEHETYQKGSKKGQFRLHSVRAQAVRNAKTHVTVADEIRLRLRWAGIYQASGWITTRLLGQGRYRLSNPRGKVIPHFAGGKLAITLINQTPGAAEYGARTGYIARALRNRIADMQVYVQRKIRGDAYTFSKPRPKFSDAAVMASVKRALAGKVT